MERGARGPGRGATRQVSTKAKRAMAAMAVVAVLAVAASWQFGRLSDDDGVRDADVIGRVSHR